MYYVYTLYSLKDKKLYTGCTNDINRRLKEHNSGSSPATHLRTPFKMVYCEMFINKHDAFIREQWLKTGWGRNRIKKTLAATLESLGG